MNLQNIINNLKADSNHRSLPEDTYASGLIDFSSNDYLGIVSDESLRNEFLSQLAGSEFPSFTSSASRLLAANQGAYYDLENLLSSLYGNRAALIFNSGYHANTGIVQALGGLPSTLIVADKLVHASIIDGIVLSKSSFRRFRHNDLNALESILRKEAANYDTVLVVTESVFSMDGDSAPLRDLIELKRKYSNVLLYVDEAHAFGVEGPQGLGLTMELDNPSEVDVIVGTFGKAAASFGAFAITSPVVKDFLVNKARSLIFSTALPPAQIKWSLFVIEKLIRMDEKRSQLKDLGKILCAILNEFREPANQSSSHIQPLIIGDSKRTLDVSASLANHGIKALPIRRPTVLPGTERLRFSLSASMNLNDLKLLGDALRKSYAN